MRAALPNISTVRRVTAALGILLVMSFPPRTRLWAAMALLTVCAIAGGACAGFLLGGWWVAQAGALAGAVTVVLSARITIWLCHLQSQDAWKSIVVGDGRAEGAAEMALWGAILYEAAAFPLAPGGVSTQERRSRRTIAYRMAAYDDPLRPASGGSRSTRRHRPGPGQETSTGRSHSAESRGP